MKSRDYTLGPDSLVQPEVPKGTMEKRRLENSRIYPGAPHDYWVYVPDQYRDSEPACMMCFEDGSDDTVVGVWEIVVNYFGDERCSVLTIKKGGGQWSATLSNEEDGDLEISAVNFNDEVLCYEYKTPPSQMNWEKERIAR